MRTALTAPLLLCLAAATAHAQPAYRVKDVAASPWFGSDPNGFVTAGGVTYFAASDTAHRDELWRTDGTPGGTWLLKDIGPGQDSQFGTLPVAFAGGAWFVADAALWRTDGTTPGTVRVRAIGHYYPNLVVAGGRLFFSARDEMGMELWSTDGTAAGTARVADIAPGAASSDPYELVSAGALVYFAATGPAGRELWRSDGTAAGTLQVQDIRPGPSGSGPFGLTRAGTRIFFTADDAVHGRELWATGLDTNVTALVRDIVPSGGALLSGLTAAGGNVFFEANDGVSGVELWTSDGTEAGTRLVRDITPGAASAEPSHLTAVGAALYFTIGAGPSAGQLWKSDGTAPGTTRVPATSGLSQPRELTAHDGALFFSAYTAATGNEIWRTDGSAPPSMLELRPGAEGTNPRRLTSSGGRLFFAGPSPGIAFSARGEPWTSDGTVAGSTLLRVIDSAASSDPRASAAIGDVLLFGAQDRDHGTELWRSDGTEAGTWMVADIVPGSDSSAPWDFTPYAGALYFTLLGPETGLWRTDGTPAGTFRVSDVNARDLIRSGQFLYFAGYEGDHGSELWRSDGTGGGTAMVRDVWPGPKSASPRSLTNVNGTVFFKADDPSEGTALWKSDGTEAGTVRVDPVLPGPASADIRWLTAAGGLLYFAGDDGLHGLEPWVSDGTPLGTRQVRDVRLGPEGSAIGSMHGVGNGIAFFDASDGTSGSEPWRTDGSEAGTFRLADAAPGTASSTPTSWASLGDTVLFSAESDAEGREVWRSDGTAAGTGLVRAIAPGPDHALGFYQTIGAWGGWAYFGAADAEHGHELWRSDGTAAGTTLVQDLRPGPLSSAPEVLSAAGGRLFLSAVDDQGREPWLLRPELTVANATADEATHALVDVVLVPRLDVPLATPFSTVDNSAVAGSDFTAASGVLTFAPGETQRTVDVTVLDDAVPETVEQFFVYVAPGPNAFATAPRGIVTIADDDDAPSLSVEDASVPEGDGGTAPLVFTVRLSGARATPVTVDYATAQGTAASGIDFDAAVGTLTFPPGVTARTVTVAVRGDALDEPDEFFPLHLASPVGATAPDGPGIGRIADDDGGVIRLSGLDAGMDVTATLGAEPHLYLFEVPPFRSYEVTVDAASGDLGDDGPVVELLSRDLGLVDSSAPVGVGHARTVRMIGSTFPGTAPVQRYVRVRSAGCGTSCGADDTYRIRLRETTGRIARYNQTGTQQTVLVLQNTTDEFVETEIHWRRADGTAAGANLSTMAPRATRAFVTPSTADGTSGSIVVVHKGPFGALAGKAVSLDPATGLAFDTPLETHPR